MAHEFVKELLPRGSDIYAVRLNMNSGTVKHYRFFMVFDGKMREVTRYIAGVLDMTRHPVVGSVKTHGDAADILASFAIALYCDHKALKLASILS